MLTTQQRPALDERAGRLKSFQYSNNRRNQVTKIPKKSKGEPSLESAIKEWCVDLLAEAHFDGANSLEHRWAKRFWSRCGGRLKNV